MEPTVEVIPTNKRERAVKICGHNFIAKLQAIELNEEGIYNYCRWNVRQADWIKGMIVWESDTHRYDDSEEALTQAITRLESSLFPVQPSLLS